MGGDGSNQNKWLPGNRVLQLFLSKFLHISGGPAWIRTRGTPLSDLLSVQRLDCQHAKGDECVDSNRESPCNWKPSSSASAPQLRSAPASTIGKCAGRVAG